MKHKILFVALFLAFSTASFVFTNCVEKTGKLSSLSDSAQTSESLNEEEKDILAEFESANPLPAQPAPVNPTLMTLTPAKSIPQPPILAGRKFDFSKYTKIYIDDLSSEFSKAYQKNKLAAEEKYLGKRICTIGRIEFISKADGLFDDGYVLRINDRVVDLYCELSKEYKDYILKIENGDAIAICGYFFVDFEPKYKMKLKNCTIIKNFGKKYIWEIKDKIDPGEFGVVKYECKTCKATFWAKGYFDPRYRLCQNCGYCGFKKL